MINSKLMSDAKLEGREPLEILGLGKAFSYTLPYWDFVVSLVLLGTRGEAGLGDVGI